MAIDPRAVDRFNSRSLTQTPAAHAYDPRPRGGCKSCVHSKEHPVHADLPFNVTQFGPRRTRRANGK